jgi:hypothetical protein
MSEAEKRRRFYYKQNRNKWLRIGSLILACLALITVVLAAVFFSMDRETFIRYTEEGDVDYSVTLKNNEIFGDVVLGEDNMYVASLLDTVKMDFSYKLLMEQAAKYTYSYDADAHIVIKDSSTKKLIYKGRLSGETEELLKKETISIDNPEQRLSFSKTLYVNYAQYNDRARAIVEALSLKGVTCTLEVAMNISVNGTVENFDKDKNGTYTFSLEMPLNVDKVSFSKTSGVPTGESKIIITNEGYVRLVFLILAVIFLVLTALFALAFIAFIFLTRNTDINYNIKVNKVVSNYKSYIQKIVNPFDRMGYQLLILSDFNELLEIRDTIQSPILMNENEDKTCTTFMIPTNTKLLYIYEIKVADYDEIYKKVDEGEETPITTDELPEIIEENTEEALETAEVTEAAEATETVDEIIENAQKTEEELVLLESVDEEMLATATAMPTVSLSEIDYDEDDDSDDEEEGVEVIGVVWPSRKKHNKVYRYDPNGERVTKGDIVLVPSKDVGSNKDIIRKATVAHGNHKVEPENLAGPLKKIIGVFKRKAEEMLMPKDEPVIVEEMPEVVPEAEVIAEPAEVVAEVAPEAEAMPYENEEVAVAEAIEETTEETAAEATEETVAEATEETVAEATEETVAEATEETVAEATEEILEEPTEENTAEAAEEEKAEEEPAII